MTKKHDNIHAAIAAAAAEIDPVERDTGGQLGNRKFQYASLAAAVKTIRPILAEHGLGVVQPPVQKTVEGVEYAGCRTIILHESGGLVESETILPLDGGDERNPLQNFGKVVSYCRRYSYPFFVADDEADAPEAAHNQGRQGRQERPSGPRQGGGDRTAQPISEAQLKRLQAKLGDASDRDREIAQVILGKAKDATGFPQDASLTVMPRGIYDAFCRFIDGWPESGGEEDPPAPEDESQDPQDAPGTFPDDLQPGDEGYMSDEEIEAAFGDEVPNE